MSNLTHGMDLAWVEEMGHGLQAQADALRQLTAHIDGLVSSTSWIGADAERFKHDWWPGHRSHITAAADDVHGLGQSALNNAKEQAEASGVATEGSSSPPAPGATSPDASAPGGPGAGPAAGEGRVGATSGVLPNSHRTWQEADAAYRQWNGGGYGAGGSSKYQCTAWANFRWQELGYTGGFVHGDGSEMAGNAHGSPNNPPTLGAMASYGSTDTWGHVMIVEEVAGDRIRVSEMNMGGNGGGIANPDEFRSGSWLVRQPNGSWAREGGSNVGAITFAPLPR